jgi:hypothetical protein
VKPAFNSSMEVVYLNNKLRKTLNAGNLTLITGLGALKLNVKNIT